VRRSRISLLASAVAGTAAVLLALTPAATAATATNYVALGDSYSSGVGAGNYISTSGDCLRSTSGYPYLWYDQHTVSSFKFVACSGATTTDVINNQISALSTSTTLVSITIGGNDVGFAQVMEDCNLYGTDTCVAEVNAAENTARTQLPGWLDNLYSQIHSRAPYAKVVVLGYPRFYDLSAWYCPGLSSTSRSKINEGADVLDGVISTEVSRYGFSFADVRSSFADGHEICDYNKWLHSVDWSDITQSYHPYASGYSGGYLPAMDAKTG